MRIIDVLQRYVQPALGCTEPAAVALAAAAARRAITGEIEGLHLVVDKMVLRNALAVAMPGSGGQAGIAIAAALGAIAGKADMRLEVLSKATEEQLAAARALVDAGRVAVDLDSGHRNLYIEAKVSTSDGVGRAVIQGSHTNITLIERNGQNLTCEVPVTAADCPNEHDGPSDWLRNATVSELVAAVEEMPQESVDFVLDGIAMNARAAQEGLRLAPGLGIGARLAETKAESTDSSRLLAPAWTAAAVDARMSGLPVSVMTSSGSGNQGIAVTLPCLVVARSLKADDDRLARAVALGHLLLARMREELGALTPLCGSALHAAAASSAAMTWLLGGSVAQIGQAAALVLGTQGGILCDGAKPGCALKAATGAQLALQVALLCVKDLQAGPGNGLMGKPFPEVLSDLAVVARDLEVASDRVLTILAHDSSIGR